MEKKQITKQINMLAIGGSAGSFEVLLKLIPLIKADIEFPILIILHRKSNAPNSISDVFKKKTKLPVLECDEKEALVNGKIYFAPADYHLLIEKDRTVSLDYSEKVNYSRPSIDITFKSLSDVYGENLAAILLSGANSDGAEGLHYIQKKNGTTIVQDPIEAEVKSMPQQAIKLFDVDYILNTEKIINLINNLNT